MPDTFKHSVPTLGKGQKTFQQCWFASYRMMMSFLGRSEGEIEPKLRGAGIAWDEAMAKGLLDNDYRKAANALGLAAWTGSPFNKKQGFFDVGLSDGAEAFLAELVKGPLWVSRRAGQDSFHIVVAVGYDDDDSRIFYNNPFPGPDHAVELKWSANLFVRSITDATGSVQGRR